MLHHITTRQARCAVQVVMRRDEESVVLMCKTTSWFIIIYYFSSQLKLNFTAQLTANDSF